MPHLLDHRREQIATLCHRHHVRRLDLFGSAATGHTHAGSDFDFLVEFDALPPGGYTEAYFGLREDLQSLLGAPIDLVVERAVRNPYFRQSIERSRESLYAA